MVPIADLLAIVVVGSAHPCSCALSNSASNVEDTTMDIRTERATQPVGLTDAELDQVHGGATKHVDHKVFVFHGDDTKGKFDKKQDTGPH